MKSIAKGTTVMTRRVDSGERIDVSAAYTNAPTMPAAPDPDDHEASTPLEEKSRKARELVFTSNGYVRVIY